MDPRGSAGLRVGRGMTEAKSMRNAITAAITGYQNSELDPTVADEDKYAH